MVTKPLRKAVTSLSGVLAHQPRSECRGLAATTEGVDCREPTAAARVGRVTCSYKLAEVVATAGLVYERPLLPLPVET